MSVTPTPITQSSAQVYWIIVSDEGTSTKPHKHVTYDLAYSESIRLSRLKPGINFAIFKAVGNTFTVKPVEPKTEHTLFTEKSYWYSYPKYYTPYPSY